MPEKHDSDDTAEDSLNRRKAIQFIGAGAFSIAGLGGISSASPAPVQRNRSYDVTELTSEQKDQAISDARRTSRFKKLQKYFEKEYGYSINKPEVSAYDLTISSEDKSKEYRMVTFPLDQDEQAEIVIILQNGEFVYSNSGIVDADRDKETIQVTAVSVENGQVNSQVVQEDLSQGPATVGDDEVSTQISQCGICTEVTDFICDNGCGLSGLSICAAVGLANAFAGVGCAVISQYMCWKIDTKDCSRNSAREICLKYKYDNGC